jgi:hypothetical protein
MARRVTQAGMPASALEAARRAVAQAKANKAAAGRQTPAQTAKANRAIERAKERELKAQTAELRAVGMFQPKAGELTRGRKQRIRAAHRELEDRKQDSYFAAYPTQVAAEKRKIAALAKSQGDQVTRRGVFVPREMGEMRGAAVVVKERGTGLWKIKITNRFTDKKTGKRRVRTSEKYLDGMEAIAAVEPMLQRRVERAIAGLGKGEGIRFTIGGPMGNVSRATFHNWEGMRKYLESYRKDPRAMAAFMASLTIYTVRKERPTSGTYRVPTGWVDAAGRLHEAAPENLYGGELFPVNRRRKGKGKAANARQRQRG